MRCHSCQRDCHGDSPMMAAMSEPPMRLLRASSHSGDPSGHDPRATAVPARLIVAPRGRFRRHRRCDTSRPTCPRPSRHTQGMGTRRVVAPGSHRRAIHALLSQCSTGRWCSCRPPRGEVVDHARVSRHVDVTQVAERGQQRAALGYLLAGSLWPTVVAGDEGAQLRDSSRPTADGDLPAVRSGDQQAAVGVDTVDAQACLLYTSPSPRD